MNYGKAVEEVWAWREAFEKELCGVPRDRQVNFINKKARESCKKLGIKCRTVAARAKEHA